MPRSQSHSTATRMYSGLRHHSSPQTGVLQHSDRTRTLRKTGGRPQQGRPGVPVAAWKPLVTMRSVTKSLKILLQTTLEEIIIISWKPYSVLWQNQNWSQHIILFPNLFHQPIENKWLHCCRLHFPLPLLERDTHLPLTSSPNTSFNLAKYPLPT